MKKEFKENVQLRKLRKIGALEKCRGERSESLLSTFLGDDSAKICAQLRFRSAKENDTKAAKNLTLSLYKGCMCLKSVHDFEHYLLLEVFHIRDCRVVAANAD